MHAAAVGKGKYMAMVGDPGGKDWGVNEAGMKQMDDNIGVVFKKIEEMGEMDNTIIVFTTDNGAETFTFPDGGITPFKGSKMNTWEGGMRSPCVIRWPGHIKPGIILRDTFFYYSGSHPSAVRYKNWKMYFAIAPETATGFLLPGVQTQFAAGVVNLTRDPFETAWGDEKKANFWFSGALAGPVTAYIYDWNLLPIGQVLWLKELETYQKYPPMQDPASYNLDQVMEQLKKGQGHPSQ